jgi:excisionase family DNA binding protein
LNERSIKEIEFGHREPKCVGEKHTEIVSNGVIGRRLLNVREAAQYLGLEVDTVYKKSRLREVPCVKVGRALRFDVKTLER